jgi:hypothetical protein
MARDGFCRSVPTSRPMVSVTKWRLRPLTFLPASETRGLPLCAVSTGWLSMTRADRLGARRFILLRLRRVIAQHLAQMLSGVISVHSLCLDVCST